MLGKLYSYEMRVRRVLLMIMSQCEEQNAALQKSMKFDAGFVWPAPPTGLRRRMFLKIGNL